MRYTKKSNKFVNAYEWNRETPTKTFVQLGMDKLGQLEDIEEELNLDLMLFSKVLVALSKHCVFVKEMKLVHKEGYSFFEETGNINRTIIVHFSRFINGTEDWFFTTSFEKNAYHYLVEKYGKTWALTKEELL